MRRLAIVWAGAVGLLAVALLFPAGSRAGEEFDAKTKGAIDKIAAALEKGDAATAEKLGKALAAKVEELNEVMYAFKLRTGKGKIKGVGVGDKPGEIMPDGIELKLQALADGVPAAQIAKESKDLIKAAWRTAAIAEVAITKPNDQVKGKAKMAEWVKLAEGARDGSKELVETIKKGNADAVKAAAIKVSNNCNTCHMKFRK